MNRERTDGFWRGVLTRARTRRWARNRRNRPGQLREWSFGRCIAAFVWCIPVPGCTRSVVWCAKFIQRLFKLGMCMMLRIVAAPKQPKLQSPNGLVGLLSTKCFRECNQQPTFSDKRTKHLQHGATSVVNVESPRPFSWDRCHKQNFWGSKKTFGGSLIWEHQEKIKTTGAEGRERGRKGERKEGREEGEDLFFWCVDSVFDTLLVSAVVGPWSLWWRSFDEMKWAWTTQSWPFRRSKKIMSRPESRHDNSRKVFNL